MGGIGDRFLAAFCAFFPALTCIYCRIYPQSKMKLALSIASFKKMQAPEIRIGCGTDSYTNNNFPDHQLRPTKGSVMIPSHRACQEWPGIQEG